MAKIQTYKIPSTHEEFALDIAGLHEFVHVSEHVTGDLLLYALVSWEKPRERFTFMVVGAGVEFDLSKWSYMLAFDAGGERWHLLNKVGNMAGDNASTSNPLRLNDDQKQKLADDLNGRLLSALMAASDAAPALGDEFIARVVNKLIELQQMVSHQAQELGYGFENYHPEQD